MHILSGTGMREASPAAAADDSRWPIFDFSDVHETDCLSGSPPLRPHNVLVAAPTWRTRRSPPSLSIHLRLESVYLNRIPERRPRAVSFESLHGGTSILHRYDKSLLGGSVRRRQARTRAILLHRRPEERSIGRCARRQQKCPAALGAAVTVSPPIEGVASTESREHPCYAKSQ